MYAHVCPFVAGSWFSSSSSPWDWTQVIRFGGKHFYPPNYLVSSERICEDGALTSCDSAGHSVYTRMLRLTEPRRVWSPGQGAGAQLLSGSGLTLPEEDAQEICCTIWMYTSLLARMLQNVYRIPRGSMHLWSWHWGTATGRFQPTKIKQNKPKTRLWFYGTFFACLFFCAAGPRTHGLVDALPLSHTPSGSVISIIF